ncbi:hypothetical protein CGRA01v4_13323 [Colletotrichum graminicola]|nr:hypothetical protein CGRA01v4_13323 [Colletotrichum graminicola]
MTSSRVLSATQASLSGLVLICVSHAYTAGATSAHAPPAQLPSKSKHPTIYRLYFIGTAKSKSAGTRYRRRSPGTRPAACGLRPEELRADDRLLDARATRR